MVGSTLSIKTLDIMIDAQLNCRKHLEYACQKAASATVALKNVSKCWQAEALLEIAFGRGGAIHSAEAFFNFQRRKQ